MRLNELLDTSLIWVNCIINDYENKEKIYEGKTSRINEEFEPSSYYVDTIDVDDNKLLISVTKDGRQTQ